MIYHSPELDSQTGLYVRSQAIYIAGKPAIRIPQIKSMYEEIESLGHTVTYKWANDDVDVKKPYRINKESNLALARNMIVGATMADVFIFINDEDLHGAKDEKGAFLGTAINNSEGKKLYIIEDGYKRESIFDSFGFVEVVHDTDKIFADLGRISILASRE